MNRALLQRFGLTILCGAAGYGINALPLSSIAALRLGRIITLPIAMLFGPWYGALSAFIGALPYRNGGAAAGFVVWLPIEAIVVGAFARRGKSPLLAGTLVWVTAALSLVIAPQLYGIGYLRRYEASGLITPRRQREFYGLIPAYVFALLLVSVSNNLGILWIAVELTTLASVANNYFDILATQERLTLARANLANAEKLKDATAVS